MFEDKVAEVARLRSRLQVKQEELKARKEQFEDEVKDLYLEVNELQGLLSDTERELRTDVVGIFNRTGEKHPHPALGVRVTKSIEYDTGLALQYAKVSLPDALKLDTKTFTKVMKDLAPEGRPEFVQEVETPTATIATDLGEFMPVDQEAIAEFEALMDQGSNMGVVPEELKDSTQDAIDTLYGGE